MAVVVELGVFYRPPQLFLRVRRTPLRLAVAAQDHLQRQQPELMVQIQLFPV